MNKTLQEGIALAKEIKASLSGKTPKCEVIVGTPFIHLASVCEELKDSVIAVAAENCADKPSGAYTGEVSAEMLAKLGCAWVVVGHSERREYHGETDEQVAAKAKAALGQGVSPIVCVGEPLDIREAGTHVQYVVDQTKASLAGLDKGQLSKTVIAYEPVWAIGTGKVASAADAQEVCAAIRNTIKELAGDDVAAGIRILYGGSVKADSVAEIVGQPDVDGGLVGGASLDGEAFAKLCANAAGGPF